MSISKECPIKNHAFETSPYKTKYATRDCIEDKCAWWDEAFNCCSFKKISIKPDKEQN